MEASDDFWEDLLSSIDERRVIPIVGPELLCWPDGSTLDQVVARELALRLRLLPEALPPAPRLEDVVQAHVQRQGLREDLYPKIRAVLREVSLQPPPALQQLAAITDFDLFISLTYDDLLLRALDAVRHRGEPKTLSLAFAPRRSADLPASWSRERGALVYNLLGKVSTLPEFVISEADTLEFLCAMQTEALRPQRLFDELQNNHLLLLGCGFPDWLARFFIRIAKSRALSTTRAEREIIVDREMAEDGKLIVFLRRFSYNTRVMDLPPLAFVQELARRWQSSHQQAAPKAGGADAEMPSGAIFISYASEDRAAAECLYEAIRKAELEVWFDRDRLQAGELYDQLIRRNVKECTLFIPLVSANTEQRLEGYFRREWRLAADRSIDIAQNVPFIVPVLIDDTANADCAVPEAFQQAQWTSLPGGAADAAFCDRLVTLSRSFQKWRRGVK